MTPPPPAEQRQRKRDDGPKVSPAQDLANRIKGLEEAKTHPSYSPQDLAALDRTIQKLKGQLEYLTTPRPQEE